MGGRARTGWIVALLACAAAAPGPSSAAPAAEFRCVADDRIAYAPWVFFGYACHRTCSDHKAGFAWAERNGIGNPAACRGRDGFLEGCRIYAEATVTAEQAGFEWARENEVVDSCQCAGAGGAFRAGCEAYLEVIGN